MIPVHRPFLAHEELDAVRRVFDSRWLGMGAVTERFEAALREFLDVKHVIAVNTGTAALHIALEGVNLPASSEVIVPSLTFAASVQAILAAGGRPVFCEVNADTLNMDMDDVRSRMTPQTRAIMPVHFAGQACDFDKLRSLMRERRISIVDDAAHAFGSSHNGRKVGTLGDVTCFSFDPIKNITCGEGGAVATNHDSIAERIMALRNVGINHNSWQRIHNDRTWLYEVVSQGYRYHMSDLSAAIGLEQFKRMSHFRARKREIVRRYDQAFGDVDGLKPLNKNLDATFPFSYVVRVLHGRRDALMGYLREEGIGTTVNYIPNHLQPAFAEFRTPLPVTEQLYDEIVTLPLYVEMIEDDVDRVVSAVLSFFDSSQLK